MNSEILNKEKYIYPPDYNNGECHAYCDRVAIKGSIDDIKKDYNKYMFSVISTYNEEEFPVLRRTLIADIIRKKIQEKLHYDVGQIIDVFDEDKNGTNYKVFKFKSESEEAGFEVYINKDYKISFIKEIHVTNDIFEHDIPLI